MKNILLLFFLLLPTAVFAQTCPGNSSLPAISGTPQVGNTLTVSHGTWTNSPNVIVDQWFRGTTPVSGANGTTYNLTSADVGSQMSVEEFASNSTGPTQVMSIQTAAVTNNSVPVNTAIPTISGITQVGQTLTATYGTWTNNPTSFSGQWYRDGSAISGQSSLTYTITSLDVGHVLTFGDVAFNSSGESLEAVSNPTSTVTAVSITSTNLTSGVQTSTGVSINTASITPTANTVIIASVAGRNNSGATNVTPTISGLGLTWINLGSVKDGSGGSRSVTLFGAEVGSSPSPGVITFSYGSTTQQNFFWSVDQFTGLTTNGSNLLVQQAGASPVSGSYSGITVTLGTLASSSDAIFGYVRQNINTPVTIGSAFTQLSNVNNSLSGTSVAETGTNQTVVNWSWANQSNDTPVAIAVELAHQ